MVLTVTVSVLGVLRHEDELTAATLRLPPVLPIVALIEVPVAEPLIDHPVGTLHEYDEAPGTAEILYVIAVPEQGETRPDIAPGRDGRGVTVTARVLAAPEPQLFLALTPMFPPEAPASTCILTVPCPPAIVQPLGTVHA